MQIQTNFNVHTDLFSVQKFNLLTEMLKWEMKWLLGMHNRSCNEYFLILCIFCLFSPFHKYSYYENELINIKLYANERPMS